MMSDAVLSQPTGPVVSQGLWGRCRRKEGASACHVRPEPAEMADIGARLVSPLAGAVRRIRATSWRTRLLAAAVVFLAAPVLVVGLIYVLPPRVAVALGQPLLAWLSDAPPLPGQPPAISERSVLLAADGSELATLYGDVNRVRVTLDDVPDIVVDALLAAEDDRFYDHPGVDHRAVMRAVFANLRAGDVEQGGSTITQQLVRTVYLDASQTATRKFTEAWYALQAEDRFSKDEILQRYLNETYFGQGTYGIGAAAELYFDRPVSKLDVGQAAVLVGLIPAPSERNPVDDEEAARRARDTVLRRMVITDRLDETTAREHLDRPLGLQYNPPPPPAEPFFVEYVRRLLLRDPRYEDALGDDPSHRERLVEGGGLRVHTTLDPRLQDEANAAIAATMGRPRSSPMASLVTVAPDTGAVLAMAVGPHKFGRCEGPRDDCRRTMVNPAVAGLGGSGRQPGSAFKPFVVAAALAEGVPVGWEERTDGGKAIRGCSDNGGPYRPENYSPDPGVKDMTEAVRVSNNVYHAKLAGLLGPERLVETGRRLGLSGGELPEQCSVALGSGSVYPLDMAAAYATFANGGSHCEPLPITRIELGAAAGGDTVEYPVSCRERMSGDDAARVNELLQEPVEDGTATAAQLDRPVAGKTGTTDDYKDAWFAGYVPQLSTAVWIGFERPRVLRNVLGETQMTGGSVPARLWARYMRAAVEKFDPAEFRAPPAVDPVPVPRWVGTRARAVVKELRGSYEFNIERRRVRDYREAGTVIGQRPRPNTLVDPGKLVVLRVSDGRGQPPEVPDVIGMRRRQAVRTLRRADYEVEVRTEQQTLRPDEEPAEPQGTVIRQQPSAGTNLEPGSSVRIVVVRYQRQEQSPVEKPDPKPTEQPSPDQSTGVEVTEVVADPQGNDLQHNGGEYVTLTATDPAVDVSGWTIEHTDGGVLEIGNGYRLARGEWVDVHTGDGKDNPRRYFNGLADEVLADEGGELIVRDRTGREVTRYQY
ncbi:MAG: PASTA domain-containing protein [Nitriliruptorales bacterium]|nr:PASTA domain-containing protein [Nitriliruptorales bacterium]